MSGNVHLLLEHELSLFDSIDTIVCSHSDTLVDRKPPPSLDTLARMSVERHLKRPADSSPSHERQMKAVHIVSTIICSLSAHFDYVLGY
jgi:hypothetical protein